MRVIYGRCQAKTMYYDNDYRIEDEPTLKNKCYRSANRNEIITFLSGQIHERVGSFIQNRLQKTQSIQNSKKSLKNYFIFWFYNYKPMETLENNLENLIV